MANTFYNGNQLIKSSGVVVNYTQQQLDEYVKCASDPVYFISNYCKVISLDKGIVNFELYDYQKRLIKAYNDNRFVISMQPRQSGKTATTAAYILYYVMFSEEPKNVGIVANKAAVAREIMSRIQAMYELLPTWLQLGVKSYNKGSIEFENRSKIFTGATTASGLRSSSINLAYIDEFAIVPNNMADAFLASTYPTISSGITTKIILTSTPLGLNHFYKFWTEAESNTNGFVPVKVHWSEHPSRDIKWAEEQKRLLGDVKFNQEVECNFLGSSYTLINSEILRWLTATPPIYSNNNLDVFEKPIADHVYILIADVAKGVGGDYSAFQVLDVTQIPYKQVCKFRDNTINPLLYPSVIYKTATQYNTAYVLIEINVSEQVPHILYNEYEYDNLLFVARTNKGQQVTMGFSRGTTTPGVHTDKKVKRIGCIALKALIEEKKLLICDFDTIDEINTFIEVKDSYAADDGKHDDLVMPLVLFGWFTTNGSFNDFTDVNLRVELYKKRMDFIENEMIPIGFRIDGTEEPEEETLLNF